MAEREVGNLRTRLSWEDDGASRALTGFRQDLKGLRSEMNAARSGGKEYTNSLKGLRQQSDILTRRFKTQQLQVKELGKRFEESRRIKGEDAKQTKNLSDQYNNAVAQMNRTENQLNDITRAIEEQTNPWKRLSRNMTDAGDKMQTVGRNMTDFGRNYSMRVTAPIVAGGVAIFKAASDYESAFAGVEKTVDGTAEQMQGLRQSIRDMAKEIPSSTTEIAKVAEAAGQLGIKTESIEEFTRTMIDLGEATNMTSDQAATEFARFANIVGMSQDDFDKLGSTVVALGNNLATTESEISSMAMRLAGAGAQVGLTEAEIMSFAAALSSVGIEAEAGGSAFSKVMVNMQLAVEKGGDSLNNFAKVAGMSASDFKKAYKDDATKAISTFIEGLSTAEDRGLSAIGILDEMGIKEVRLRDTLLRAAGASDVFSESLEIGSKAWEENTALTEEAEKRYATTESQMKILWNRIKDIGITLGEALIPAVMDAIDAAQPLIDKIESGAEAFADMNEEQQQTILKMIGLVAAIGPVSVGLGGLTTTIGGLLKVGGSLTGLLGKAGGKGLLGRFGLMGVTGGPVGIAIAGVAALGLGIYATTKDMKKLNDVNYELVDSVNNEISTMDELSKRFEDLHGKNKLTTDEMLRYMDIMSELKDAKNEDAIKALTDEQNNLLKKSGLTNDEMDEFLELNDTLVEKTPNVTNAISEQGNAYINNLDTLKELNEEKRKELIMNAERELEKALENETQLLKDQKDLTIEINETQTKIDDTYQKRLDKMSELEKEEIKQKEINTQIKELKDKMSGLDGNALTKAESKLALLELEKAEQDTIVEAIGYEKAELDKTYDKLLEKLKTKRKDKEVTEEEIKEIQKLQGDYEELILAQAGITAEKGRGLIAIDKEIEKNKEAKEELKRKNDAGEISTKEYEKSNRKLETQKNRLDEAKKRLENINELAGKTVYDKKIDIFTNPSIDSINKELSAPLFRTVNVATQLREGLYADGTPPGGHPGGPFIAGEEGFELGRMGNHWELLNFGRYERPAGYQVFPHDESKKIIRSLNNLPGYASGARPPGEANRVVSQLDNSMSDSSSQVVSLLQDIARGVREGKIIQVNGQSITEVVNENNAVSNVGNYF
ncbi:phage tail tape measure protein [Virgibacillus sp. M23]|uniref:phage tail tape measure protein n=1 Tax=Virgibacillus sp. M23 TaxID=3079030 RepID=UPI002A91D990|nr:phage tail tape measure protein [Virgibacillus sp. M23]MDY7044034.1 phage tail tape measure protein [Virgibacillus sp. M23]